MNGLGVPQVQTTVTHKSICVKDFLSFVNPYRQINGSLVRPRCTPTEWYSTFKTSLSLAVTPLHRLGRSGDSKSLPGAHKTSGLRAAGCGFLQWQSTERLRLRSHFAVLAHGTTPSQLSGSQQTIGAGPLNSRGLLLGLLPLWRGAVIYTRG